jgi:hypothetical protein
MSEKAKALLSQIKDLVEQLNEEVSFFKKEELEKQGLNHVYYFGGPSFAPIGVGTKPIIPKDLEHTRNRALKRDIDYQYYREKLRAQKISEPEVWNRFPPQNNEEIIERDYRLYKYSQTRLAKKSFFSEFEKFCHSEAKLFAKKEKRPIEVFLADKEFLSRCKALWELEL